MRLALFPTGTVHYWEPTGPITARSLCGGIEAEIATLADSTPDKTVCNVCNLSALGGPMDELRRRIFIDSGLSIKQYTQQYTTDHPNATADEVRENVYAYIQSKLEDCRKHIEQSRIKEQAFFSQGQAIFLQLSQERRENLRRLDVKYRPSIDGYTAPTRKTVTKEEKALKSIMDLMKIDEPTARKFLETGVLPQ